MSSIGFVESTLNPTYNVFNHSALVKTAACKNKKFAIDQFEMAPIKMIIPQGTTKTFGWIHIHCHGTNNRLQSDNRINCHKSFLKMFLTVPNKGIFS